MGQKGPFSRKLHALCALRTLGVTSQGLGPRLTTGPGVKTPMQLIWELNLLQTDPEFFGTDGKGPVQLIWELILLQADPES